MNAATEAKVIDLSTSALRAAIHEDWDTAQQAARKVTGETGFEGLFLMLTALADWTIQAQAKAYGRPAPMGAVAGRPAWVDEEAGTVNQNADEVDPAARWAGQFVTARGAMDHDMTHALAAALPDNCGPHVFTLLRSCAKSVRLAGRAS